MPRQDLKGQPRALASVEVNTPYEIQNRGDINIFVEEAPTGTPPVDGRSANRLFPDERIRKRRSPSTEIYVWTEMQIDTGFVVYNEAV